VPAISDACIRLLDDPSLARKLGAAGTAWIHADFTWDAMARRLTGLIEQAVNGGVPVTLR
jgi:phosphatidylinositol alpha-1,6-mannosyltransferase